MSTSPSLSGAPGPTADEFAERMLNSVLGWVDTMSAYLGDRLGWYRSLDDSGPATPDELAARTATSPRYAREWLEQQAVSGVLTSASTDATRFPRARRKC